VGLRFSLYKPAGGQKERQGFINHPHYRTDMIVNQGQETVSMLKYTVLIFEPVRDGRHM
jgi:hypothetical protein